MMNQNQNGFRGVLILIVLLNNFMDHTNISTLVSGVAPYGFQGLYPPGCDTIAAQQCEYDLLKCRLFTGPANDAATSCNCGRTYYGQCLRRAGCEFAKEVGALTQHQIYTKTCVDLIVQFNCPEVLMCATNCASDTHINPKTSKIIPFNNYGKYYLRVKICQRKINSKRYAQYAMVELGYCTDITEYTTCARYIPPFSYTPVAVPIDTSYLDVDYCEALGDGTYYCFEGGVNAPVRFYGNTVIWPKSFDVPRELVPIGR